MMLDASLQICQSRALTEDESLHNCGLSLDMFRAADVVLLVPFIELS